MLGESGAFNRESATYQPRQQQIDMAVAVDDSIQKRKHALIEAGTGTGKTFAYLVPAIKYAVDNNKKIVISTKTKNLQTQILTKDIPFLERIIPFKFKTEKIIGLGNFICFHRLLKYLKTDDIEDIGLLRRIVEFYCRDKIKFKEFFGISKSKKSLTDDTNEDDEKDKNIKRITTILDESDDEKENEEDSTDFKFDGIKEDIDEEIDRKLWGEICAESDSCHRKRCVFYGDCYYFKAKEKQKLADILVVNHALFFSDLAVRKVAKFALA